MKRLEDVEKFTKVPKCSPTDRNRSNRVTASVIQLNLIIPLHIYLMELGHFFAAIALQLLSYFAKYPVL